jgi:hypothetical protein
MHAALEKIYGPAPPGQEWRPGMVWYERYEKDPSNQ